MYLKTLGWNEFFQDQWNRKACNGIPARVVQEQKESYRIAGEPGEMAAEVTGRLRHTARDRSDFPAVGDWVSAEPVAGEAKAVIHDVLPRRTRLSRKVAGHKTVEQIVAANVDVIFLVTSLNSDFSIRRIERYLGAIWSSGAQPVILLNKADLCEDPEVRAAELAGVAAGVPVHTLTAIAMQGIPALHLYLKHGTTAGLVGSSGVGKSTIINCLLGAAVQDTGEIRAGDGRGKHVTTCRRMFVLESGGVLIDTPGMREFQGWDSCGEQDGAFEDIVQLAGACRFRDCRHEGEPGCAVRGAIEGGSLDGARLEGYQKLQREFEFLDRKKDAAAQAEQKRLWKQRHKAVREHYKLKGR